MNLFLVFLGWLAIGALMIAPVVILRWQKAQWRWFGLGIAGWVSAVIVKAITTGLLDYFVLSKWHALPRASVEGLLSAVCELGMAALIFAVSTRRARLTLPNVLAFGAGAGVFEVLFVLLIAPLDVLDQTWGKPGWTPALLLTWMNLGFLVERLLAVSGHIASRAIIYFAVSERWLLPALVAILLFSVTDGIAAYGVIKSWNWEDEKLLFRFYSALAILVCLEVSAAYGFWRRRNALGKD